MLSGSLVAIVTPMLPDGALDLPRLKALIDWHVAEGTDGIVIVGTTGESPTVDVEEHCKLIESAVRFAAGRIPVIAGTGGNATREAIALSQFASHTARVPPAIAPPSSRSASSTPLTTLSPLGTRPGPRPTSCSTASTAPARSPRPQQVASWTGPS